MATKVRIKTAKKTMQDPELIDMFNQMMGTSEPDPSIVVPKYDKIMRLSRNVIEILEKLTTKSPFSVAFGQEFASGFEEVRSFISVSKSKLQALQLQEKVDKVLAGKSLEEVNSDKNLLQRMLTNISGKYDVKELARVYKELKESFICQEWVMIVKNIKPLLAEEHKRKKKSPKYDPATVKQDLEDKDNLSDGFIRNSGGFDLPLFNFSRSLNFKAIFSSEMMSPTIRNYTLYVLHIIYNKCITVVRELTTPDIDVDKFSELLVGNIEKIQKHPELSRCTHAFAKIKQSVGLLKTNFGGYYKDFVQSQNPGIIIEEFVMDVAKSSKANAKTTMEFRRIISFYKKHMTAEVKNNPQVAKIFNMVNQNLKILEEHNDESEEEKSKPEEKPVDLAALGMAPSLTLNNNSSRPRRTGRKNKKKKRKRRK